MGGRKLKIFLALLFLTIFACVHVVNHYAKQKEAARVASIAAHVPDDAAFGPLLAKSLADRLFDGQAEGISFELLRREPTEQGDELPKFYAWVRAGKSAGWREGAVKVAAVQKTRFEVLDFVPAEKALADQNALFTIFPAPLVSTILARAQKAAEK